MKYFSFILTLCLIFGISPSKANADQIVPTAQVASLVEWVETRTNVMLLPRPKIFVSDVAVARLDNKKNGLDTDRAGERIAAYRNGTIFISTKYWRPGDTADDSVMVHELVHYAQEVGFGQSYACANQREAEAYQLQNDYLAEHDEKPFLERDEIERLNRCE